MGIIEWLIPALLAVAGGVTASAIGAKSAKNQMKFQAEMSGTAHQREVEDLKRAGINPLLTAGGSGASSPIGAMYSPDNPLQNLSADYAMRKKIQMEKILNEKQGNLLDKEAKSQETVQKLNSALAGKALADTNLSKSLAGKAAAEQQQIMYENEGRRIDWELYKKYPWLRTAEHFIPGIGGIVGTAAGAKFLLGGKPKARSEYSPKRGQRKMGFQK